jgi:hypothetical protein
VPDSGEISRKTHCLKGFDAVLSGERNHPPL